MNANFVCGRSVVFMPMMMIRILRINGIVTELIIAVGKLLRLESCYKIQLLSPLLVVILISVSYIGSNERLREKRELR